MFQFLQSLALDFLYTSGVHFLPGNFRGQENKLNSNVQKIIKSSSALCTDAPPPPPPPPPPPSPLPIFPEGRGTSVHRLR